MTESRPWLFSYITLRAEAFGLLAYNPFLGSELSLGEGEAKMLGLFDGRRSVEEVALLSGGVSVDLVEGLLARLESIYACTVSPRGTSLPAKVIALPLPPDGWLSAPKSVTWELTRACNLRCPHCLNDSGRAACDELDAPSALALAEELKRSGVLSVSLVGGEPLLRPDVFEIIDSLLERPLSVDIATNGFGVSDATVREIARRRVFHVQVSIDGIGEAHDAFRGRPGAFEEAQSCLRRLRGEGVAVSVSATATSRNINAIGSIIDWAAAEGASAFKAIPFVAAGRGKLNAASLQLDASQYRKLCELILRRSRELEGRMSISLDSTMHYLVDPDISEPAPTRAPAGPIGCSAGNDILNIGPDGRAYPCPFLSDFPLGNLREEGLPAIWASPTLMELRHLAPERMNEDCRSCGHLSVNCGGGCRAAAYLATGSLYGKDPCCFKGRA